jgi:cell division protein ZapE
MGSAPVPCTITVHGRNITLPHTHGDIAFAEFQTLCGQALGPADYIEIARTFSTLILANIPIFGTDNPSEAKRFITLIDELYEHGTKLICSAADYPSNLCQNNKVAFEFKRTASRLTEMQSPGYFAMKRKS